MVGRKFFNKHLLIAMACFSVLFVSFFGNVFGAGQSMDWYESFQEDDSAQIIKKTVQCRGELSFQGPAMPVDNGAQNISQNDSCADKDLVPYGSQFGLQARIISSLSPDGAQLGSYFKFVEIVLSLLTALVFTIFIIKLYKLYNIRVAGVVFALIAISPWIVAYARNMYWITFLIFLPFIFSFVTYSWFRSKRVMPVFYVVLAVLFTLKLLDGYEHISTLLLSAFVPIVYFEIGYYKTRLVDTWKQAIIVLGAGIISLMIAVAANVIALTPYYGSWSKSLNVVAARAEQRSVGLIEMQSYVVGGFRATLPDSYRFIDRFYDLDKLEDGRAHPIKYAAVSLLNYALLPAVSLPVVFREPVGGILQSIVFVGILAYIALCRIKKRKTLLNSKVKALRYSYWLGLVAAVSWLVLMPGHAYPHAHLNAIVFYLPFLLVCYLIFGIFVDGCIKKLQSKSRV